MKRLLRSPVLVAVVSLSFAILAATLEQVIGLFPHGGWSWVKYFQDIVRNGFVAVALALVTTWIKGYQETTQARLGDLSRVLTNSGALELAVSGWSRYDGDTETEELTPAKIDGLRKTTESWAELAERVNEIHRTEYEAATAFTMLNTVRFPLYGYMAEGGRQRRLLYATRLTDDLVGVESSADPRLAAVVRTFRRRTWELAGGIQHTNATVVERLLVEAVVPLLRPRSADDNHEMFALRDAAVGQDPLYLVVAGMGELSWDDQDHIEVFAKQVNRTMGALRNELRAAIRWADSVIDLAEAALQIRAELSG